MRSLVAVGRVASRSASATSAAVMAAIASARPPPLPRLLRRRGSVEEDIVIPRP